MKKLYEITYADSIFMKIELDFKIYCISCYAGADGLWNTYKTTAKTEEEKEKVIKAFNLLY